MRRYAEWLGVDLVVLRPRYTFEEYASRYGYWGLTWKNRWCYYKLKREPVVNYLRQKSKQERERTMWVLGIRGQESRFRLSRYTKTFDYHCYGKDLCVQLWLPLVRVSSHVLDKLIRDLGIPRNPVWDRVGISGECLCLAGTTKRTLDRIITAYPDVAEKLARIDEMIHRARRNREPSYPAPLVRLRVRLSDYVKQLKKNRVSLDNWIDYEGKACQGDCVL